MLLQELCVFEFLFQFFYFLFFKLLDVNFMEHPVKQYAFKLAMRRLWFIVSNVLERFNEIAKY